MIYMIGAERFKHYTKMLKFLLVSKPKTFHNEECTNTQCKEYKHRSFSDLLEIVQTYFPEVTERQVADYIINHTSMWFCSGVKKLVCVHFGQTGFTFYSETLNNKDRKGVDGYSYNSLLAISKGEPVVEPMNTLFCFDLETKEKTASFPDRKSMAEHFNCSLTTISNAINKKNTFINTVCIISDKDVKPK